MIGRIAPSLPGGQRNKEVLILGSGPSARIFFANTALVRSSVDVFGLGMQIRFYRKLGWWPNYWAMTDSKVAFAHFDEIRRLLRFAPSDMAVYLPEEVKFRRSPQISLVPHSSTGGFAMSEVGKLGYSKVYLLGIEGNYTEKIEEDRGISAIEKEAFVSALGIPQSSVIYRLSASPQFNPNYFSDSYHQPGDIYSKPLGDSHKRRFTQELRRLRLQGIKVWNLSPLNSLPVKQRPLRVVMPIKPEEIEGRLMLPPLAPALVRYRDPHKSSGPESDTAVATFKNFISFTLRQIQEIFTTRRK